MFGQAATARAATAPDVAVYKLRAPTVRAGVAGPAGTVVAGTVVVVTTGEVRRNRCCRGRRQRRGTRWLCGNRCRWGARCCRRCGHCRGGSTRRPATAASASTTSTDCCCRRGDDVANSERERINQRQLVGLRRGELDDDVNHGLSADERHRRRIDEQCCPVAGRCLNGEVTKPHEDGDSRGEHTVQHETNATTSRGFR